MGFGNQGPRISEAVNAPNLGTSAASRRHSFSSELPLLVLSPKVRLHELLVQFRLSSTVC